jgi:hypothetical protein
LDTDNTCQLIAANGSVQNQTTFQLQHFKENQKCIFIDIGHPAFIQGRFQIKSGSNQYFFQGPKKTLN